MEEFIQLHKDQLHYIPCNLWSSLYNILEEEIFDSGSLFKISRNKTHFGNFSLEAIRDIALDDEKIFHNFNIDVLHSIDNHILGYASGKENTLLIIDNFASPMNS